MSDRDPTLIEILENALRRLQLGIRTMIPAKVVKYHAPDEADVQPVIESHNADGTTSKLPQITRCKIAYPRGGGWHFHWDLDKEDTGYVLVPDRSIDQWLATGKDAPPGDARLHPLSDAVFHPQLGPDPGLTGTVAKAMTIGRDDGSARLQISTDGKVVVEANTEILLGSETATAAVARVADTLTSSAALALWASQVEAGLAAVPVAVPAPTFAAGPGLAGALGTIHAGSGKVKAD